MYNRNTLGSPPVSAVAENTFVKSSFTCDGQIKWDNVAQRWLYYSLDCGVGAGKNGNRFTFGFSKSANPLPLSGPGSAWCNYHVDTGSTLEDYGKLGNSNGYMIIGTNEYAQSNASYTDSAVWALPMPKNGAKVSTCPTEKYWSWTAPTMYTPEPANISGSSNNGFIVGLYLNAADDTHLRQYVLKPPASGSTSPVLQDLGNIAVPKMDIPASVPQPGSSDPLDSSDTRLTQANAAVDPALKTFGVWTQNTVAGAGGGPSVVRWYELKGGVAQTSPVQTGTVSVPGAFAFNGAIAPDAHGDGAAIEYNVGSATQKVQVRARIHAAGSAAGSTVDETTLATSTGIDHDFLCPSRDSGSSSSCRWGDYAGASSDPICQGQVYGTNELNGPASSDPATWATQNFRLVVDECPTASFIVTTSSPTHGRPVGFDGSGSKDPDGSIVSYTWKFGDGTSPVTTTTPTTTHTFGGVNTYQVYLTVKDSSGLTGTTTKSVTVS